MTRAAFVIPWFGQDLVGGAEQHIFQVATRLAKRGHRIEVLATCCRSFPDDWQENQLRVPSAVLRWKSSSGGTTVIVR